MQSLTIEPAVKVEELVIEKGISQEDNVFLVTAKKMEVGDSVLFKYDKEGEKLCRALLKAHGVGSFTMKQREDEKGFRVWRTKRTVTPRKPKEPAK